MYRRLRGRGRISGFVRRSERELEIETRILEKERDSVMYCDKTACITYVLTGHSQLDRVLVSAVSVNPFVGIFSKCHEQFRFRSRSHGLLLSALMLDHVTFIFKRDRVTFDFGLE